MSKVEPINFNNIFSLGRLRNTSQRSLPNFAAEPQIDTLSSVHNASSQINARTPVSYSKIAELSIPEVENKAQIYKLSNGQKVVLVKKEGPTIVQTFFKTGGFNEPDHLRGISHFIEHNLFNGSERLKPREYNQTLAKIGAYTNAYTTNNVTSYYALLGLGQENLETLIRLNAEQVQFPTFPHEQIEKEKGIVCSEINMIDDDTQNTAKCTMLKDLFQITSDSTDLVAGNINNINALTREDLIDYYNTYYTPDNSTTVIVGDIDPDKTMELVSKYYTKQNPLKRKPQNHEILNPISSPKRTDLLRNNALSTSISIGFAGPKNMSARERMAISLALLLLDGGKNSKLTKALNKHHVNGQFEFEEIGNQPSDNTCISYNISTPDENSEEVLSTIYKEISRFTTNPPSQEEFEIAKQRMLNEMADENETVQGLSGFIGQCMMNENKELMSAYKNMLQSMSLYEVSSIASKYLDLNKASICMVHPSSSSEESIMQNYRKNSSILSFKGASKTNRPMFETVREYTLPNKTAVAVYPVSNTDKCIYTTTYTRPATKDMNTAELAVLTYLLNNGSAFKTTESFAKNLDKNNIELSFDVTPNTFTYTVRCPQSRLQNSFDALREVMFTPRFTRENLEEAVKKTKNILSSTPQSPKSKLIKALFPNLAIGETNSEIIKSLDSVSLERIRELYSKLFENACASSVLTAPINQNPVLENIFTYNLLGTIAPSKKFEVSLDDTYIPSKESQIFCYAEENAQASISQAYKFKRTGNIDDDAKIGLLNTLLGGGMNSRLFLDLREIQKLAYAVNSEYDCKGNTGYICFNIKTTTNNLSDPVSTPENITKSLAGFKKHVEMLKTQPVSEDELEHSKAIMKNSILEGIETKLDKTILLSSSKNNFYGIEQAKALLDAIDRVTVQDIQDSARYIFSSQPVTSIVASKNTLDALNLKE